MGGLSQIHKWHNSYFLVRNGGSRKLGANSKPPFLAPDSTNKGLANVLFTRFEKRTSKIAWEKNREKVG